MTDVQAHAVLALLIFLQDATGSDSDRSDRQQANSEVRQAHVPLRVAALWMESCCAVTIRAPARDDCAQQGRL